MFKWLRGGGARKYQPRRIRVIDATTVDSRRRLVLIRRDNVEHLLMIGGPTDVLIEPNIIRATARELVWPAAPDRLAGELSNRLTPSEVPLPPARSEAPRVTSPLMEPRGVRSRTLAPPEESARPQQTVYNLEDITRRLEAALGQSPAPQVHPPVTDPLAFSPQPSLTALARSEPSLDDEPKPKSEPKTESKFEPPKLEAESKLEPKAE